MLQTQTDSLIQERFRSDDALSGAELDAAIEALLMVADSPVDPSDIAEALSVDVDDIDAALHRYAIHQAGRGWILQRHGAQVQLTTAPRFAEHVRRFLGIERQSRLSPAALETLAIVAYRQPVTRSEIEAVRGVDCTGVLATLIQRALIEVTGRGDTTGNPILYGSTPEFLMHFGLSSIQDLPPLGDVNGQDADAHLGDLMAQADHVMQESEAVAVP